MIYKGFSGPVVTVGSRFMMNWVSQKVHLTDKPQWTYWPTQYLEVCCLAVQSCQTLWDLMDCNPSGSSVRGIFQAIVLEWLPFPSPGDLPDPGIHLVSPALAGGSSTSETPETLTLRFTDRKINSKEKTCLLTMKTSQSLSLFEHIWAVLLGEKPSPCLSICSGQASCQAPQLDQMYDTLYSVLVAKWVFFSIYAMSTLKVLHMTSQSVRSKSRF